MMAANFSGQALSRLPAPFSAEEFIVEFDIVINGGGLVGASLASALKSSGLKIALVEGQALPGLPKQPSPQSSPASGRGSERENPSLISDWDSRIYAFTPGNVEFLKELGA